jgi:methyl-accepting chemotaxis protein
VDANVQNLDDLVEEFTQGVKQSTEVFGNVRTVTGQAVKVGQVVSQSSQQIGGAARSTTELMADIAQLATQTAQLTQQANQQTERMESLSQQLLDNIQFFRLPGSVSVGALPAQVDLSVSDPGYIDVDSRESAEVSTHFPALPG